MIFHDTIVALSSGRLPAGVAVMRISGPQCRFVVETICGSLPRPRLAAFRTLKAPDGTALDNGLVVFFPGPNSFTGEDVAEFQIHGGRAVVSALLQAVTGFDGVRHAEPGEFTRRAFLNGKVDLVETEALADLINAETEAQRRFAVEQRRRCAKRSVSGLAPAADPCPGDDRGRDRLLPTRTMFPVPFPIRSGRMSRP